MLCSAIVHRDVHCKDELLWKRDTDYQYHLTEECLWIMTNEMRIYGGLFMIVRYSDDTLDVMELFLHQQQFSLNVFFLLHASDPQFCTDSKKE